jgi:hypothetical protein
MDQTHRIPELYNARLMTFLLTSFKDITVEKAVYV